MMLTHIQDTNSIMWFDKDDEKFDAVDIDNTEAESDATDSSSSLGSGVEVLNSISLWMREPKIILSRTSFPIVLTIASIANTAGDCNSAIPSVPDRHDNSVLR